MNCRGTGSAEGRRGDESCFKYDVLRRADFALSETDSSGRSPVKAQVAHT